MHTGHSRPRNTHPTTNNWRALLALMRQYLRPHRLRLSVLLLLLLTDAAAQLALPLLYGVC